MQDLASVSDTLKTLPGLKRSPIAITLLPELPPSTKTGKPARFCEMWARAAAGETVYATAKEMACAGGAFYLGLAEASEGQMNGTFLSNVLHLYATPMAAVRTRLKSPRIPFGTGKAVLCTPLDKAGESVDMVMLICTPAAAMKLTDAALYSAGGFVSGMTGPAACSVAFAGPYLSGTMTYCVADSGSRESMDLEDDEMILSIPGDMIASVAENLRLMSG